jgi:hypothetical protein
LSRAICWKNVSARRLGAGDLGPVCTELGKNDHIQPGKAPFCRGYFLTDARQVVVALQIELDAGDGEASHCHPSIFF